VTQISLRSANGLCTATKTGLLTDDFYIDPNLVEVICLAHEWGTHRSAALARKQLHALMQVYGGFERNAQKPRLLTETIYPEWMDRIGMKPTRAFLHGVLKYKPLPKDRAIDRAFCR
jgi:dGTPase